MATPSVPTAMRNVALSPSIPPCGTRTAIADAAARGLPDDGATFAILTSGDAAHGRSRRQRRRDRRPRGYGFDVTRAATRTTSSIAADRPRRARRRELPHARVPLLLRRAQTGGDRQRRLPRRARHLDVDGGPATDADLRAGQLRLRPERRPLVSVNTAGRDELRGGRRSRRNGYDDGTQLLSAARAVTPGRARALPRGLRSGRPGSSTRRLRRQSALAGDGARWLRATGCRRRRGARRDARRRQRRSPEDSTPTLGGTAGDAPGDSPNVDRHGSTPAPSRAPTVVQTLTATRSGDALGRRRRSARARHLHRPGATRPTSPATPARSAPADVHRRGSAAAAGRG